jgi:hypothetical protein
MKKLLTFLIALAAIVFAVVSPASAQGFNGGGFNIGLGPFASGGGGRTCTDDTASTNFLTRTGGSAPNYGAGSAHYADAICTFIKALETAGLITGTLGSAQSCGTILDAVYLIKAHTATNAGLNICGTAFTLVNHGATFTVDAGYTGAASSYVDTQFIPNSSGGNHTQNNVSFFAGTSTNFVSSTAYGSMLSQFTSIWTDRIFPHFSDDHFYYNIQSGSGTGIAPSPGHFYGLTRNGASTAEAYVDTTGTVDGSTSTGLQTVSIILVADDTTGTNPFTGIETFASIGANLTGPQEAALQSAYATYVASVP